ncbi:MAG TPA: co-chaperone GroES [Actinomycetota bacterium]|nr:co-chaperone GroES [Actinomycetota bacterium]
MPRATAKPAESKPRSSPRKRKSPTSKGDDIRLTGDRLVVLQPEDGERRSRSGLLIPATAASAPKRLVWGEVTLVGPDVRNVRRGDRVLFLPQVGLEVEISGDEFLLLRERDVQAVSSPATPDGEHHGGQYL